MKINEIADEVYGIDSSKPFSDSAMITLTMFAERIINETINLIDTNVGMIDKEAREDLLKHLGVDHNDR